MAKNKFTLFLGSKQLRKTPERYAILDKIFSINGHFDIESLHDMLESDSYHVSKATVYNTIGLLIECGLVRRHSLDNKQTKYEKIISNSPNHQHLICTECGKIKEVKDNEFSAYMKCKKIYGIHHKLLSIVYIRNLQQLLKKKEKSDKRKIN